MFKIAFARNNKKVSRFFCRCDLVTLSWRHRALLSKFARDKMSWQKCILSANVAFWNVCKFSLPVLIRGSIFYCRNKIPHHDWHQQFISMIFFLLLLFSFVLVDIFINVTIFSKLKKKKKMKKTFFLLLLLFFWFNLSEYYWSELELFFLMVHKWYLTLKCPRYHLVTISLF